MFGVEDGCYDYGEVYGEWLGTLSDEEFYRFMKEAYRDSWEKERNVKRDKLGRLNKGARIAQKSQCSKEKILAVYREGKSVKEIASRCMCSKSTVYNVLKEHKDMKLYLIYMSGCSVQEIMDITHSSEKRVVSAIWEILKRGTEASILEICGLEENQENI
ncbi:MAG: helix-turn-helix domain-containing protein [Lachnospiraceae bacterium]|nr:helix-turn-helix domain-containing protein [Lachnospiraceae bacterium]